MHVFASSNFTCTIQILFLFRSIYFYNSNNFIVIQTYPLSIKIQVHQLIFLNTTQTVFQNSLSVLIRKYIVHMT